MGCPPPVSRDAQRVRVRETALRCASRLTIYLTDIKYAIKSAIS